MTDFVLTPDWPAPARVRAFSTTRLGGHSLAPYDSMNLGAHVGDDPETVRRNRETLQSRLGLPSSPAWLEQVHETQVERLGPTASEQVIRADASVTEVANRVCVVMTADCLPVLFCDQAGTRVAAAHAGWRGLAAGMLEATVAAMGCPPERLLAWIGPAIGRNHFEVGDEVRQAFTAHDSRATEAFRPSSAQGSARQDSAGQGPWLADMVMLARQRLENVGVHSIHGGEWCTFSDSEWFYSYRRESKTGRMASLIYLHGEEES